MMVREIVVSDAAWADLDALIKRTYDAGQSATWFSRELRDAFARHGISDLFPRERRAFETRSLILYREAQSSLYAAARRSQLLAADFALWVYRGGDVHVCPDVHAELSGLVLPSDDPFWEVAYPPNSAGCACYVLGARSAEGAIRVGGDPGKSLPDGWRARLCAPGLDRGYGPSLRELIVEAALGQLI